MRYRLRVAFWSVLFAGLVGVFVYYVFRQVVRTPLVAYIATNYASPIPPNAWASEDLSGLRVMGGEGGLFEEKRIVDFQEVPAWESKSQWIREIRQRIASAKPGGPSRNAIIIYLSLHGVVDEKGEPCLIPPGARGWKSGEWVRVRELLTELFLPQDASGQYAARIKTLDKLLILDCGRIDCNWSLGQFCNAFPQRLSDVVQQVNVPKLYILNSTSGGQAGWSAPELRGSVFGYFLAQGLNGAADVEAAGNHDKQVSLRELYGYLKAKVSQWVIQNRDDLQEPMLLPENAPDVPLVFRRSEEGTVVPEPATRDARWDRMAALWKQHAALRAKTPYRQKPLEWQDFQSNLLRAEQLLEAGSAYEREFDETAVRLANQASALGKAAAGPEAVPYSLALAERWRRLPSEQDLLKLPAPWLPGAKAAESGPAAENKPADAKPPGKEAAAGAAKETSAAKPDGKPATAAAEPPAPEGRPRYDYWPAATVAWKRALEHHDTADDVKEALAFVDGADGQPRDGGDDLAPKADVVEVQFLRMLAAYLDAKVWNRSDLLGRALNSRQMAEAAIASRDLETQYWIRNLVDEADRERRLAEDKLYVGSADALKQAEGLWEGLAAEDGNGGKYREALRRAQAVSKALAVRDRAWAEGPYLAESLLSRLAVGKPDAQELRSMLEKTEKLAALLEDTTAEGKWPAELPQTSDLLEKSLQKLAKACDDECYALGTTGRNPDTLRRISAVLALPLTTGKERNELREKYLDIMFLRQKEDVTGTGVAAAARGLSQDWLARLTQWEKDGEHPALVLLDLGAMEAGEKKLQTRWPEDVLLRLAAQGEKARTRLAKLPERAQDSFQETRTLLAKKEPVSVAAIREGCCKAERALRASAAFFAGSAIQDVQVDPVAELQRFDLHSLLVWQARRVLDDFWGPKPGTEKPYFETVARDYLRSAGKLLRASADLPEGARLEQLTAAVENVIRPSVEPENLLIDAPDAEIPQSMKVAVGEGLPQGEAAVFLEYSRGALAAELRETHVPWRRMAVEVKGAEVLSLPEYLIAKDWQTGSRWRAVALYRGHVRTARFNFAPLRGVEIACKPETYRWAKISVLGESKQQTAIMFILDCSGSMGLPVDPNNPSSPPKLDVARDALGNVLNLLATADKEACRVGLMVYGHRVWENDEGAIVTRNPNNLNELVPVAKLDPPNPALLNLQPDADIEVLGLQGGVFAPLTEKRVEEIKRRLDKLNNMGRTPLYLAIMQAADELNLDVASQQKHIIVLTDGVNEQLHAEFLKTSEQLRDRLNLEKNKRIRLDIVGFQMREDKDKPEYKKMEALVQELKLAGRGELYDVGDLDGLLAALRKSLALSRYEVDRSQSMTRVCPPLELNKPCEVKPLIPGPFQVRLVDAARPAAAKVVLEGGEWLELTLRQTPWGLVHKRYDFEKRDFCDRVPDPADLDRSFWIGAHLPKWEAGGVEFYVSVQNGDETQFSPRPCEAWVEITPLPPPTRPNDPKKFVFYDMSFQPDKPVPVLRCLAPRWPKQAEEAEIELWCKFRPTLEDEVPLGKLKQFHVPDVPDVRFDVRTVRGMGAENTCKIVINEWHPKGADIYRLKLDLQAGAAGPVEIHRLFDANAGDLSIVRHEFYLDGNPSSADIDNFVVRIVSQKRLKQDAVTVPRKLRVRIPQ